jgi:hypothetical protein
MNVSPSNLVFVLAGAFGGLVLWACGADDPPADASSSSTSGSFGGLSSTSSSSGTTSSASTSTSSGGTSDGGPATPPPGACLNDTLAGDLPPCPQGCTARCATITRNFKKAVAAEAIKNLTTCTAGMNQATTAAVAKACVDTTGKAYCDALVENGCGAAAGFAAFREQCGALVNGLSGTGVGAASTAGRKALYDCLNDDGNGLDCTTCQDSIKGQ